MKRIRALRLVCIPLCLGAYTAAWLAFLSLPIPMPENRIPQLGFIFGFALLGSIAAFFLRPIPAGSTAALVIAALAFIANVTGPEPMVLAPAMVPLLLFLSLTFSAPLALTGTTILAAVIYAALQPHSAWGHEIRGLGLSEGAALSALGIPILIMGILLRHYEGHILGLQGDRDRLDTAYRKLADANLDFQTYALFAREEAMETERRRLAGELHDIIGYTLTNLIMLIQAAQYGKGGPEETGAILEKARLHADCSLQDARRALAALRERRNDRPQGAQLFLNLAKTFQDVTGVQVYMDFTNLNMEVPGNAEKILYRIIQEGLTNAFRHGKATKVVISFWRDDFNIHLRIRDNGTAQIIEDGKERQGIGLAGLLEQVEALNGSLQAKSAQDGFVLSATLPMELKKYG